jgi:hypothetical protein
MQLLTILVESHMPTVQVICSGLHCSLPEKGCITIIMLRQHQHDSRTGGMNLIQVGGSSDFSVR